MYLTSNFLYISRTFFKFGNKYIAISIYIQLYTEFQWIAQSFHHHPPILYLYLDFLLLFVWYILQYNLFVFRLKYFPFVNPYLFLILYLFQLYNFIVAIFILLNVVKDLLCTWTPLMVHTKHFFKQIPKVIAIDWNYLLIEIITGS